MAPLQQPTPASDFRAYVHKLIERGEMLVVEREVDPRFELAAVISRSQRESERPIIFKNVKGSRFPVVANVYGSFSRMHELVGAEPGRLHERWKQILDSRPRHTYDYINEVAAPADLVPGTLSDLPQILYREKDAAPYITAGVFLAKDPHTGIPNLSFARCMLIGDNTQMRCCIDAPHDLAKYQSKAEASGRPLEVAILIGAPPSVFLAAASSLPIDEDELQLAAQICGGTLDLYRCAQVDLQVPVATEIVIEATIRPGIRCEDGPFGEFLGYYCAVNKNAYLLDVKGVSWRANAYYQGLLCGAREDHTTLAVSWGGRTYRRLIGELPGILDVTINPVLYSTIVKIDKQYEGHAQHVMLKVFAANPYYNLMCIVVDADIDIRNLDEVWWAFLTRGRLDTRTHVLSSIPAWDYSPDARVGGRIGIDATIPFGRKPEYERSSTPGEETLNLTDYFAR
jgi:4-hydroxybenzoate decarboxylase